jgi:hypothetical protein
MEGKKDVLVSERRSRENEEKEQCKEERRKLGRK